MLGAQKFYGQLDLDNATYSFDCLRADAKVAHLRKGVNGAKRVRHGGGGDALEALARLLAGLIWNAASGSEKSSPRFWSLSEL